MSSTKSVGIGLAGMLLVVSSGIATGQEKTGKTIKEVPAPYSEPGSGAQMWKDYCAACHGAYRRWRRARGRNPEITTERSIADGKTKQRKIPGRALCIHIAIRLRWPCTWHLRHAILGAVVPFT